MDDTDGITVKLSDLLRHPEDLDKIPALKSDFTRKKAAIDGQLKLGLKDQLELTQAGMTSIADGQRSVNLIKEEMMKIDKLCAEAQDMIRDFPNVNLVSQTHRNFSQVEQMKSNLDSFNDRLASLEVLLREDDGNMEEMPNLIPIHYELSQLRNIRDDAMDQIKRAADHSLQSTLEDYFAKLDDTIAWFDEHVGIICLNLINVVQSGKNGMVVRLAVIIEEEEKNDKRVKALQEAQKDYGELAARFKSITTGPKEIRGYKEKFLESIKLHAEEQFVDSMRQFNEDPDRLEKSLRWFFNELNTVKLGMTALMPKKWRIFKTYGDIYHGLMHDNLVRLIDDPDQKPANMLAIIHWSEKYYAKMAKLGFSATELQPHVIDEREAALVREWRQLIIKFLDEWMLRIARSDRADFLDRKPDVLERDENGYFRTRHLVDTWRMLHEQTQAAGNSQRVDVTDGVIDAMFRTIKERQAGWQRLVDDECARHAAGTAEPDSYQTLQDWIAAVANDQIACIDDGPDGDQPAYLTRFARDYAPLVSPTYAERTADAQLEALRDGFVDLGTHCIARFAGLIFAVDFRAVLPDFFTPRWYGEAGMKRLVSTFDDYLQDYQAVMHPSMRDILVAELADELLVRYLSAVRNRGARFRRADPFEAKIRDDVLVVFAFFDRFDDFALVKQKWRVVDWFARLLAAEKAAVAPLWLDFKREYPDAGLAWAEAVLRARDDFERGMLKELKARAAEAEVVRGVETIMSKVK
ncbi:MAG: hypothetical protein M1825_001167 [Sarcosagium campestre]|nr:MAG: hypothetical protein M1825_001167 [Sarcosagium campestre]